MSTTFSLPGFGGNNNNFSLGNVISGIGNLGSSLYNLGLIGGNAVRTDRGAQLGARQGLWNIFNYSLPQGQNQQAAGQQTLSTALSTLQPAQSYWQRLLSGGRTDIAQLSAPAISATLAGQGAAARQAATTGTARTGGTAAFQAEAGANTQSQIDNIINQNLMQGRAAGAQGLEQVSSQQAQIGGEQLANSLRLLGLSESAVTAILGDARLSQAFQAALKSGNAQKIKDLANAIGSAIGGGGSGTGGLSFNMPFVRGPDLLSTIQGPGDIQPPSDGAGVPDVSSTVNYPEDTTGSDSSSSADASPAGVYGYGFGGEYVTGGDGSYQYGDLSGLGNSMYQSSLGF